MVAPVKTASTPGDFSASPVSMEITRAWANGLRTKTAWAVPSIRWLSTKVLSPRTRSGSSTRGTMFPSSDPGIRRLLLLVSERPDRD